MTRTIAVWVSLVLIACGESTPIRSQTEGGPTQDLGDGPRAVTEGGAEDAGQPFEASRPADSVGPSDGQRAIDGKKTADGKPTSDGPSPQGPSWSVSDPPVQSAAKTTQYCDKAKQLFTSGLAGYKTKAAGGNLDTLYHLERAYHGAVAVWEA